MTMEERIQLDDIDEENLGFEPRYLLLFNKTNLDLGFVYPARFNKTSVAFLSGAILFVLMNTAYMMMYITSKMSKKKPNSSYGTNDNSKNDDNRREDTEDFFVYDDDYYDYYYYEDIFHKNSSQKLKEKPR